MPSKTLEFEGTWEEIQEHAGELAGKRVRLRVLPTEPPNSGKELSERNKRMLAAIDRWMQTPLTEEEIEILDGFEQFRKEHPFRLRQLSDEP